MGERRLRIDVVPQTEEEKKETDEQIHPDVEWDEDKKKKESKCSQ